MDAMTHALEALVSKRANYISDALCEKAIADLHSALPVAYCQPDNMDVRELVLNASMIAGMAFTNVSLGIVHSIAHALGGVFHISHGLADAILLPYVMRANSKNDLAAKEKYAATAKKLAVADMIDMVKQLNRQMEIPRSLSYVIPDEEAFQKAVPKLAEMALADGCTKTNPYIPTIGQMQELIQDAYKGAGS